MPFCRSRLQATKLGKRQASWRRSRMPSRCLRAPQALRSDYRCIACVHVGDRHTRVGFDRDRRHFPMRTAAILARKSSTHHMLDTLRERAEDAADIMRTSAMSPVDPCSQQSRRLRGEQDRSPLPAHSCARARAVPCRAASDDNHAVFLEFSGETAEKGKKSSRGLPSDRYVFSVKMQPI